MDSHATAQLWYCRIGCIYYLSSVLKFEFFFIIVPTCGTESLLTEIEQSFLKVNVFGELSPNMRSRQVRFRESAKANFACKDENAQLVGVRETVCLGDGSWKAFGQLKCSMLF